MVGWGGQERLNNTNDQKTFVFFFKTSCSFRTAVHASVDSSQHRKVVSSDPDARLYASKKQTALAALEACVKGGGI